VSPSYPIDPRLEGRIRRLVESGGYADATAVVEAGLRLLEEQEADLAKRRVALSISIDEGIRDVEEGRGVPAEEVFSELRDLIQ
jgi:antitoxin ParD1/3/4